MGVEGGYIINKYNNFFQDVLFFLRIVIFFHNTDGNIPNLG